jgi:hypothetical protein
MNCFNLLTYNSNEYILHTFLEHVMASRLLKPFLLVLDLQLG